MGHNPRSREGVTAWINKCYQDTHDWFTPSVHGIIHENTQSMYLTDTDCKKYRNESRLYLSQLQYLPFFNIHYTMSNSEEKQLFEELYSCDLSWNMAYTKHTN